MTMQLRRTTMNTKPLFGLLALAAVGLAACGSSGSTTAPAPPAPALAAPASSPGSTVAVKVADNKVGKILVGADGRTLYGFTNDADAKSTCYSACAQAWPPVIVDPQWTVGPGLDTGVFSTIQRDDGTQQLVAGKWPLYEYSGDAAPGDANGQGSGDVWFTIGTDAKLVKGALGSATTPTTAAYGQSASATTVPASANASTAASAPAKPAPAPAAAAAPAAPSAPTSVALGTTSLGQVLTDAQGRTLYALTKDTNGTPTCTDACAKAWPPAMASGTPTAGAGVTAALSVVDAPGGGTMLKAGKWPLYRFAGDAAPGDVNGQGSGGVWFVVGADGKLIKN
jgi:predicted lipoprotein with Yx(FWY)xxD motif